MILYFDTSALVKLFNNEAGSEEVKQLVNNPVNEVCVLELAHIELLSAVYRRFRSGQILPEHLNAIQQAIDEQFEWFKVLPISPEIVTSARELLLQFGKNFGLRTLDAMHIAGWRLFSEKHWVFITSDKNQHKVVEMLDQKALLI